MIEVFGDVKQNAKQYVEQIRNQDMSKMKSTLTDKGRNDLISVLDDLPIPDGLKNSSRTVCEEFLKTTEGVTIGYVLCCDWLGHCGMSGWIIFLIILLVLGVLAGAAAAFWFFYWRRKTGGKEDRADSEESSTKSDYDISIGTY